MKILIASGGSGGHIFPAVSLAKELSGKGAEIIFVASRRYLDRKILRDNPYRKIYLSANPMPYAFGWSTLRFLVKLPLDFLQAFYILVRFRPDVVVGFGGYTAGAVLFLGTLLNMRTVIHEQNVLPGRTNRILDRFVSKIGVSFPETKKHFKNGNTVFTGNPLRQESLEDCRAGAYDKFGLDKNRFTLLIMGGSQGARSLNRLATEALGLLSQKEKELLQVLHIAGPKDVENIRGVYPANGVKGKVFEFVENINEAYSACDLAISRAGAAAVFELASFAKPMVLIPYPSKKNNQRFNAKFLAERNAAIYKDEGELRAEELKDLIIEVVNDSHKRLALSDNAKKLSVTDGAKRLAEVILDGSE